MRWIKLRATHRRTEHINLPDDVAHRSVEGDTLILAPGRSLEVTDDEWQHIKTAHAALLPAIELLDRQPA